MRNPLGARADTANSSPSDVAVDCAATITKGCEALARREATDGGTWQRRALRRTHIDDDDASIASLPRSRESAGVPCREHAFDARLSFALQIGPST